MVQHFTFTGRITFSDLLYKILTIITNNALNFKIAKTVDFNKTGILTSLPFWCSLIPHSSQFLLFWTYIFIMSKSIFELIVYINAAFYVSQSLKLVSFFILLCFKSIKIIIICNLSFIEIISSFVFPPWLILWLFLQHTSPDHCSKSPDHATSILALFQTIFHFSTSQI